MKQKSIKVDARLYDAAGKRLSAIGFDSLNFAVEYFLAECVVRKQLPAFLRNTNRSCPVCKFYDPIHAEEYKRKKAELKLKVKDGKSFTALLHPTREGGYWCEIPALMGCCSQGSTLEEAKYMIADAAKGWLDVEDVRLRFKVARENERDSELLVFNSPEAARRRLARKRK